MKVFILLLFLCSTFSASVFAQEARKFDEFSYVPCGNFMAKVDVALQEHVKTSNSKIYVIYYEGKYHFVWNEKLKNRQKKLANPRRGDALSRAKEVGLFADARIKNFSKNNIVLIDGGYRETFALEIWFVPKSAKIPTPTPTLNEKAIKFRKGKPVKTRDCAKYYDDL